MPTSCSKRASPAKPERDRLVFATLRLIAGQKNSSAARAAGLSPSTIRKMRLPLKSGGTRYPQAMTLQLILQANGYELKPVKKGKS